MLGEFTDAMAAFPSGVTIMTTADHTGRPWGFTASSFCSLSLDPPLVLVCLAKTAMCHPAFLDSDEWAVQVIAPRHRDLAARFATRGGDKFAGGEFGYDHRGVPVLPDAPVSLICSAHARHDGGDHTILVARVREVALRDEHPLLYFRRAFHPLTHLDPPDRQWLTSAIELSRRCARSSARYAVGAVVAEPGGGVLATGFTGETGPHEHAEEVALAKLTGRRDLSGATLYSSLEPCTARRSRPRSCAGAILSAGVKRVVFAMREPPRFADCRGVEVLREGGLEVVEMGDLAPLVGEINSHVLDRVGARAHPVGG